MTEVRESIDNYLTKKYNDLRILINREEYQLVSIQKRNVLHTDRVYISVKNVQSESLFCLRMEYIYSIIN